MHAWSHLGPPEILLSLAWVTLWLARIYFLWRWLIRRWGTNSTHPISLHNPRFD